MAHRGPRSLFDIVVFMGLTASGKSVLAHNWSAGHGFPYFNTDVVRKMLAGFEPTSSCGNDANQGIYSDTFSHRTYKKMIESAQQVLNAGGSECVVLDGTYLLRSYRQQLISTFPERNICFILCHCSEQTVLERLAERAADPHAVSDGTADVYALQKKNFEYPEELPPGHLLKLDTDQPVGYLISCLDRKLMDDTC